MQDLHLYTIEMLLVHVLREGTIRNNQVPKSNVGRQRALDLKAPCRSLQIP